MDNGEDFSYDNLVIASGSRLYAPLEGADKPGIHNFKSLQLNELGIADLLVAATGLKPNVDFLKGSGIKTNWGVIVDGCMRTNFNDIYAAGNVAETFDRVSGRRVVNPNFPYAVTQGRLVSLNIMGGEKEYEGSDSMNSLKHLGLPVMAAGLMEGEELQVSRRGSMLCKLWVKDGRLVGFRLTGDVSCAGLYLRLIRRAEDISPFQEALLEPTFGLAHLSDLSLKTLL